MAVWLVRAGRNGEREQFALERGAAVIGWEELPDLSQFANREALDAQTRVTYPYTKANVIPIWVGELWAFRERIQHGDLVVMPLKTRSVVAVGRVEGPYRYRADLPDYRHTRPVEWVRDDLPRSAFDQDLLYSLGSLLTVCQIQRNDAERRILALVQGKSVAGTPVAQSDPSEAVSLEPAHVALDLEGYAADQIRTFIQQKFKGHRLAGLVTAVLKAQGYQTQTSSPGPDGGVDIIAGAGAMGFDAPRLLVQVKSTDQPIDVKALRELRGIMKSFGADQGLLVSWGGFRQSVLGEARPLFFEIRLWDAGDVVASLLEHYDRLPAELQAELPLKRIWTLVLEE